MREILKLQAPVIEVAFLKSLKARYSDLFIMKTFYFYFASRVANTKQIEVLPNPISNVANKGNSSF